MTALARTLLSCDHCAAPVFAAIHPTTEDRALFDANEHDLAIYTRDPDRPGWMRKLTVTELMEAGRDKRNLHAHHPHPQPCDRPPAPAPALF